jgi:methylthioribulose-1-phosphate dehydratase
MNPLDIPRQNEGAQMSISLDEAAKGLVAVGRFLDARGWAPATAGNYSVRFEPERVAITASGFDKRALTVDDILTVDLDGRPLGETTLRPSAETLLHTQLYRDFDWARVVLHTHSIASTALGMAAPRPTEIVLADYELLKAFRGFDTHAATAHIPVFENTQDMPALAAETSAYLRSHPATPGYLIRGHGLYTWAADMTAARRQVEALEFLFACELERRKIDR